MNKGDGNIHKDHRARLKNRFLCEGLDNFEDHQILELLLFYSIPRKDTNELAHRLLDKFGSLSAVLDAEPDELVKISGISENSAALIHLAPKLAKAYLVDKDTRRPDFSDPQKLGRFLVNYYVGEQEEKLVALYFTGRMHLIDICPISTGTVTVVEVPTRRLAELGFMKKAAYIILAHNHPDGDPIPSDADIGMTKRLVDIFTELGMPVIEHYVIGGSTYRRVLSPLRPEI